MMGFRDRFDRSKRKASTRKQRIGFAFFWLIVLCYAYFISSDANWNTESHLYPAFSLVDRHSLNIDAYQQRLGDKSYANGHWYSDKAPGLTLLAVPVYAVLRAALPSQKAQPYDVYPHQRYSIARSTVYIRYAITYILVVLPSALFAVLLWLFLCRFVAMGWALLLSGVYALGTVAYTYSTWYFSHQLVAVMLFSAFILLFTQVRRRWSDRLPGPAIGLAGLLCGYAVISEYPAAVIAGAIFVYLLAIAARRLPAALWFIGGALPAVATGIAYNMLTFGRPLATGYSYVKSALYHAQSRPGFLGLSGLTSYGVRLPSFDSLWQITFGPYRGIFLVSPVLLLFFVGLFYMWRRWELRAEFWLCVSVVCLYFLLDASRSWAQNGWSGGASVASRHLTPALTFMVLPIVFGFSSRMFRRVFLVLGSISIAIMFAIVSSVGLFAYTDTNPLSNEVLPRFLHGHMIVNWGYMTGYTGFGSLAPLVVLVALLISRLVWLFHRRQPAPARIEQAILEVEAS